MKQIIAALAAAAVTFAALVYIAWVVLTEGFDNR